MNTKRIGQRLTVSDQLSRNIESKNRPLAIESRLRFNPVLSIKRLFGLEANANLGRRAIDVFDTKGLLSPNNLKLKIFTPKGFELDIKTLTGLNAKEIDEFASQKDEQIRRNSLLKAFENPVDDNNDETVEFEWAKKEFESDSVLRADEIFLLLAVEQWAGALEYASPELRADKNFILKAVSLGGAALQYASPELKADKDVVLAAVKQNGFALNYATNDFKADKSIVFEAVKQNGCILQYAAEKLKADKEVVLAAVHQNGISLEYASPELKADKIIVLAAVKQNWGALRFASEELKADKAVCNAAAQQKYEAGSHTIVSESAYYNAGRYGRM